MKNLKAGRGWFFLPLLVLVAFSMVMSADWPMHGYNARRNGFSGNPGPTGPHLKWTFDFTMTPGSFPLNALILDNASPVIGPDGTIFQITTLGLFALNPDGTLKWTTDFWDDVSGHYTPALSPDGSRLYSASSPPWAYGDNVIVALETNDGTIAWQFPLPENQDLSYSSFAVDPQGVVYFGTRMPATVYALNPDGTLKWSYTYPNSNLIGIEAPVAVGPDGSVYCIVNTIGLVALDKNGVFKWSRSDNCGWYGWPTPCVLSDRTIIIAGDWSFFAPIIAYHPDGSIKWQRDDLGGPGGFFPGVAVSADQRTIYTGRFDANKPDKLYALDAQTGATRWSSPIPGDGLSGTPALSSNGIIYIQDIERYLYAFREKDGAILWKTQLNSQACYFGPQSPALGNDGTLYAVAAGAPPVGGDIPGRLYAFKGGSDDLIGTWDGQGVYSRNSETGNYVKLASPADLVAAGDLDNEGKDDLIGIWSGQGGVWVRYSKTGGWAKLSSTANHLGSGDMNGDAREDFLGTWDGQGVYYRDSITGVWVKLASPATLITAGDLDGDGKDDLIGIWPTQGGVWVKYSKTGTWAKLASTARDIAAGDMNGDGRDDLLATWDGQGVYYRDSISGSWVKMATPADQVTCGDIDGDETKDLIGIWAGQGGVWVKYSETGSWAKLSSTARDIAAGVMRGGAWGSSGIFESLLELPAPMGGYAEGPLSQPGYLDLSAEAPGGWRFASQEEKNLTPQSTAKVLAVPGPGEPGFICVEEVNLMPREGMEKNAAKRFLPKDQRK